VRLADEQQFSVYNFELADVEKTWKHFELCEAECKGLIDKYAELGKKPRADEDQDPHFSQNPRDMGHPNLSPNPEKARFPLLGAYDLCLKCSHYFNILDARGAISVTERVGVIARVRALAVGIAKAWVDQQSGEATGKESAEADPAREKVPEIRIKKETLSPVGS
jgi:glycyl-tRNA synthetase alpha chain